MEYKLEYTVNEELISFNLTKDVLICGKLSTNDFQLNDNSISRTHCKFLRTQLGFKLMDLGSTNGTYVNGKKIKDVLLKIGDSITIGRTNLKFADMPGEEAFIEEDDHKISMVIPLSDKFIIENEKEMELEISKLDILTSLTLLGKGLLASTTREDTFEKVGELVFSFLNPKRLFIFSYDVKQEHLDLEYSHTRQGKVEHEKINISKTIAMKAIKEKVALLTSNAQDDSRFDGAKSIIMYGITSAISVPIWTKSSIYGLIYIDTTEFNQMFEEKDLEVISIIANFTGLSIEGITIMKKLERERKVRTKLERYHSPAVVSRIMESLNTSTMEFTPYKETEATVFFMDIVGFTTRVEKMSALEIGLFLNNFFKEMTNIIFHYNGTLDKFIGDCIMAVFGAPFPITNHAEVAIRAAVDMMARLDLSNAELPPEDRIRTRIGISSGKLVEGDFGAPQRVDYTVLGNTVNVASRLESSVAGPGDIVVSEVTYRQSQDIFEFECLGDQKLHGMTSLFNAYKVIKLKI
ncbi:MAG: FHA domain-containing protein [bacterium]|nr:FHA domain-containing protein [bacterium]